MVRSHEEGVTEVLRNHLEAPQQECPHEHVAQIRVSLNDPEELIAADLDHLTGSFGSDGHQRRLPCEGAELARELAWRQARNHVFFFALESHDIHSAAHNDEDAERTCPYLEEHV